MWYVLNRIFSVLWDLMSYTSQRGILPFLLKIFRLILFLLLLKTLNSLFIPDWRNTPEIYWLEWIECRWNTTSTMLIKFLLFEHRITLVHWTDSVCVRVSVFRRHRRVYVNDVTRPFDLPLLIKKLNAFRSLFFYGRLDPKLLFSLQ